MNPSLNEIGKSAQKLSRNPLGIIALFIVLVYGIAALVLGISSGNLQTNEKLPIIWFLVIFPLIVLITFYRLVSLHHVKLYAPQDFQDKEGFFRALTPHEQKKRLEEEIQNAEEEVRPEESDSQKILEDKPNKLEIEGSLLKTISTRHAYVLAEELAIREIENEYGVSIHRQVAVGKNYGIDGVFLKNGTPIVIEIKYVRSPITLRFIAKREVERFSKIMETMLPKPSFLFVAIVEHLTSDIIKKEKEILKVYFDNSNLPVEIKFYDFQKLKEKFGI